MAEPKLNSAFAAKVGLLVSVFCIVAAWCWIFWGVHRHYGIGLHTDVECDYLGNAVSIASGGSPHYFRHPGTSLYYLLGHALRHQSLDIDSVQTVLNRFYFLSMALWCAFTALFFYRIRDWLQNPWVAATWIPIGFLLPSTLYYLQVYSGEMALWPWSTLILALSIPIFLNPDPPNRISILLWGIALGFGCGIRFSFLPLAGLGLALATLRIYYSIRKDWKVRLFAACVGVVLLVCAILLGYYVSTHGYFFQTLRALAGELNLLPPTLMGKFIQVQKGLQIMSVCAPVYLGLALLLLVVAPLLSMVDLWNTYRSQGHEVRLPIFILYLSASALAIGFSGLSHPYMTLKLLGFGVPMRMVSLTSPLVATLFIVLPGILRSRALLRLHRLAAILILPLAASATYTCLAQMTRAATRARRIESEVNTIIADYTRIRGASPRVLFLSSEHGPANLLYAVRQYGLYEGYDRLHPIYPNYTDVNLPAREIKKQVRLSDFDLFFTEQAGFGESPEELKFMGQVHVQEDGLIWVPLHP